MATHSWQVYDVAGRHQASAAEPRVAVMAALALGSFAEVRYDGHTCFKVGRREAVTVPGVDAMVDTAVASVLRYQDAKGATCNKCGGPLGIITTGAGTHGRWYQCQDCGVDQGDSLAILNARYKAYGIETVVVYGLCGDPYLDVIRVDVDPPFGFYDTAKNLEDAEAMMAYYVAEQGRL